MAGPFSDANDLRISETEFCLKASPRDAFWYFADPRHLAEVTPPWHTVDVDCPDGTEWIEEGAEFEMRLVIHGHATAWRKRITVCEPERRFVLEQMEGPYTRFVHERTYEPAPEGTRCVERIEYAHLGGSLYQRLIIQPELEQLLTHRRRRVLEVFGSSSGADFATPTG